MPHFYIRLDALRDQLRWPHQKKLEEEKAKANHVIDVLSRYWHIIEHAQIGIDIEVFSKDSSKRDIIDNMRHKQQCQTSNNKGTWEISH